MLRFILAFLLLVSLTACNTSDLSRSTLQEAIALQLGYTQQELSQELGLAQPEFKIKRVKVAQQIPLKIDHLPGYKIQGRYDLAMEFPHRKIVQKDNPFTVYLQQQSEGETWRLFIPEAGDRPNQQIWTSYQIE